MRTLQHFGVCFISTLILLFTNLQIHAQVNDAAALKQMIRNAGTKLATDRDIDEARISHTYRDEKTDIQYVYLQQQHQQIKVFNKIITIAIKNNRVAHSAGKFIAGMEQKSLRVTTPIDAKTAIEKAAEHLQLKISGQLSLLQNRFAAEKKLFFSPAGISKRNIETELVWVSGKDNAGIRLCWNVNIDVLHSADWWNVRIDANTGEFVEKDNWTVHENFFDTNKRELSDANKRELCNVPGEKILTTNRRESVHHFGMTISNINKSHTNNSNLFSPPNVTNASYYIVKFPLESPLYGNLTTDYQPWLKAGLGNPAISYGWHFDGTNNYITSRGNNVNAFEDWDADDLPGNYAVSSTAAPSLTYATVPDFTKQPITNANQQVGIINLFYWNNLVHDILYQYGFTEAAGNFQNNNLGRGGLGNDYVNANAMDGSGVNNANFSTPVDGMNGKMQMYLWSRPPIVTVSQPAAIAGQYPAIETACNMGCRLINTGPVTGPIAYYNDDIEGTMHGGCVPAVNSLTGKIALIEREDGVCVIRNRILRAQEAGAMAAIIVNNEIGLPESIPNLFLADVVIPAILVDQATGAVLMNNIQSNIIINLTTALYSDGDLDNGIIVHEYGHGISNRLTGGPANSSCLGSAETPGEGWSDWFALMLTTDWSKALITDGAKKRPIVNYPMGQTADEGGLRGEPYTTDMTINPHTYADINPTLNVHDIGEVWASAIWDMTWAIIDQEGTINPNIYDANGGGGNTIAMKLVVEGMKLQPCDPGFIDARDGILAADLLLYNGIHHCAIWSAFARRGMGFSASQGTTTSSNDQTIAFDVPNPVINLEIPDAYALPSGTVANTVYIGYPPAASITLSSSVSGGTRPYSYLWSTGAVTSSITVSPIIPTTYKLSVSDAGGCRKSRTKLVDVIDIRGGKKSDKVMICHNGITLTVAVGDVNAHLLHGDMLGACQELITTVISSNSEIHENETSGLNVKVFPNPAVNDFTLLINGYTQSHTVNLKVMDVQGRIIESKENLPAIQRLKIGSGYAPGVYFVEVSQAEKRRLVKIVKLGK